MTDNELRDRVKVVHKAHVVANGTHGHTARDAWRHCEQVDCALVRAALDSPIRAFAESLAAASKVAEAPFALTPETCRSSDTAVQAFLEGIEIALSMEKP